MATLGETSFIWEEGKQSTSQEGTESQVVLMLTATAIRRIEALGTVRKAGKLPSTLLTTPSVDGEPSTVKAVRSVCAVRRIVVSLLEAGGTEEVFLGYQSTWR